jgi:hypothetical protein
VRRMVQERTNGFLSERNSDNVKVKKHVSEPEQYLYLR